MRPLRSRIALMSASTLCAAFASFTAYADTDACSLLTPAQVSAVIGVPVGAGAHVTPTFVKTCTWQPTGASDIRAVTVNLQTSAFYDGVKQKVSTATALGLSMSPAAVGDDGFVETIGGEMPTLWFKKGTVALKVAVYAKRPPDALQALELALAKQAAQAL
jgi:hypothetical protein